MSQFTFGKPSSSTAPSDDATTATAPASGNIFGGASAGTPTFSFGKVGGSSGNTTPSNTGSSVFGQKPAGSLFGGGDSSAKTASTPTPGGNLFGAASTTPSSGSAFGAANNASASSTAATPSSVSPFGAISTAASSGKLFGGGDGASAAAKPASGNMFGLGSSSAAASPFGALGAASQPQSTTTAAAPSSGFFANTGSSLFGNKADTASTTAAQNTTPATTAATPAKSFLSLPSTTPAGAPPNSASQPSSTTGTSAAAMFGAAAAKPTTSDTSSSAAPSSLFGNAQASTGPSAGNMFGNKADSTSGATGATAGTTGSASSLFGTKTADTSGTAAAATPAATTPSALFGNKSAAPTTSTTTPSTTSTASGLFGNTNQSSTTATSTSKPALSMFGGGAAASTAAPSSSATPAASTSAASALFGAKSSADAAAVKDGDQSKEEPKPANEKGAASALGASTTGPTSEMARLKNKTMEDIVTRWASDLTKYQKEFKEQATAVSAWDRSLVDNGEKIQKLYLDTFEAERASHEIERQLAAVESQQEELEAWLNRYESEVQDMFAKQISPGEQLAGPDQERERTYKLAEKLTQHLDEKSRDLSKMVKEINDISGTLSKGAKTEDPLSQIVRVLNSHLTQLQWIDANASALQAKVTAAQKSSSSLSSHYAGPESDAAEGFYRSYYGRR
ncbi:hypothetical protein E4U54_007635 [Claviceps lovelessii]|nr:hypothetical protein E4U54_007635 [Claviceps lovelessii]